MDGNGRAVWMNEADLVSGSPRVAFEIQTGGAHHSGSNTIVINGTPYFTVAAAQPGRRSAERRGSAQSGQSGRGQRAELPLHARQRLHP
jgi:hypothetical protein